MKGKLVLICLLSLVFGQVSAQLKVILDTDPGYDPDDVGCMAMLHTMSNNEECHILAMMNSTDHKESPLALSAINHFYNRPAIPVGDYKDYPEKINAPKAFYSVPLAREYERSLMQWDDAEDAVMLYREILASAEDTSIVIVIIGTMHNFYGLLQSTPCQFSTMDGKSLVREKVKRVVTMGGNFMDGAGHDRTNWGGADALCDYTSWSCINEERNAMCRYVIENCEAPFIASGWEVGCGDYHVANYGNVITGPGLKNLNEKHLARVSYEYHFLHRENKTDISRHSNDQCALHYAIRGEGENYEASLDGKISLSTSGECLWEQTPGGKQGYIQKKRDKDLIAEEIETLMMGDVIHKDMSPPGTVDKIAQLRVKDQVHISWKAAVDDTPGSWVVAYRIYEGERLIHTAYGTQYICPTPQHNKTIEVRAVNATGIESTGKSVTIYGKR